MFNQIQGQLWTEWARRLFGGARVLQVAPEFTLGVEMFSRPEFWALHAGSLLWGQVDGVAAGGVGFNSQCAIGNPAGSNSLLIVEQLAVANITSQGYRLALSQTDLTTSTGNLVLRDLRRATTAGASGPISARIRTQNTTATANIASQVGFLAGLANEMRFYPCDLVLAPSWSLRVIQETTNTAIDARVMFWARERTARQDELLTL